MGNMITYAQHELRTMEELPFGTVDSVILTWLSYLCWPEEHLERCENRECEIRDMFRAEYFDAMLGAIMDKAAGRELLAAVAASPRYRHIKLGNYESNTCEEEEKQFAAVTFQLRKGTTFVAFRGTDSSFVGWKEDLNMAFQTPIPSQLEAAEYLKRIGNTVEGELIVGGHSKGGNLAIYACANNPGLFSRIVKIYSLDGPGFLQEVIDSPDFAAISPKIEKPVPQSSVVGMLLEQHEAYYVVKSTGKSFWQHDLFTWVVENGGLVSMPELTRTAAHFDRTLNRWVCGMSREERERFVNAIYALSDSVEANSFLELKDELPSNFMSVLESVSKFDPDTKRFMLRIAKNFAKEFREFSKKL